MNIDIEDNYEILESIDIQKKYNNIHSVKEDNLIKFINNKYYNYSHDSILLFKTKTFVKNNFKSYNYNIDFIWKQFNVDCPRMNIYANNCLIKDSDHFKKELDSIKEYTIYFKSIKYELIDILAMLSNQSSFAFPYTFLYTVQSNLQNTNTHILNLTSNRGIYVDVIFKTNNSIEISIKIETDFGFFDINEDQILSKINSSMLIQLILDTRSKEATFLKNSIFVTKDFQDF